MREKQLEDKVIQIVYKWVENAVRPQWQEISDLSEEAKFYWMRFESLIIKDGILYRLWKTEKGKCAEFHVVLPKIVVKPLLQLHDSITGGHLGIRKTLSKVRSRYFWYKLRRDVQHWCRICDKCACRKGPNKKGKAPLRQYQVGAPMERIAVDILGPLPRTKKGNIYLCVMTDYFTRWVVDRVALITC